MDQVLQPAAPEQRYDDTWHNWMQELDEPWKQAQVDVADSAFLVMKIIRDRLDVQPTSELVVGLTRLVMEHARHLAAEQRRMDQEDYR